MYNNLHYYKKIDFCVNNYTQCIGNIKAPIVRPINSIVKNNLKTYFKW